MLRHKFFTKNMNSSNEQTEQEKKALKSIEHDINSNDSKKLEELIDDLLDLPHAFLEKSYRLSQLFSDFCDSNTEFHKLLAKKLQGSTYINVDITSIDEKEHLSVFDLYIAVSNFSTYYELLPKIRESSSARKLCLQALDAACELGLYNALTARCKPNIKKIFNPDLNKKNSEDIMQPIFADTKRLINLYWSMGYVQAGNILKEAADVFLTIESEKDRGYSLNEEAIKYFLCATLIAECPESKKIENSLTLGKGYLTVLQESGMQVKNLEDIRIVLHSWAGSNANYERLLGLAKLEVEPVLAKEKAGSRPSP